MVCFLASVLAQRDSNHLMAFSLSRYGKRENTVAVVVSHLKTCHYTLVYIYIYILAVCIFQWEGGKVERKNVVIIIIVEMGGEGGG